MHNLKYAILCVGFIGLSIFSNSSLEAKTAGQKLDDGIERTQEAYENAKETAKENIDITKERAKVKYNQGLEKAKIN